MKKNNLVYAIILIILFIIILCVDYFMNSNQDNEVTNGTLSLNIVLNGKNISLDYYNNFLIDNKDYSINSEYSRVIRGKDGKEYFFLAFSRYSPAGSPSIYYYIINDKGKTLYKNVLYQGRSDVDPCFENLITEKNVRISNPLPGIIFENNYVYYNKCYSDYDRRIFKYIGNEIIVNRDKVILKEESKDNDEIINRTKYYKKPIIKKDNYTLTLDFELNNKKLSLNYLDNFDNNLIYNSNYSKTIKGLDRQIYYVLILPSFYEEYYNIYIINDDSKIIYNSKKDVKSDYKKYISNYENKDLYKEKPFYIGKNYISYITYFKNEYTNTFEEHKLTIRRNKIKDKKIH